jgi:hypothetical protein
MRGHSLECVLRLLCCLGRFLRPREAFGGVSPCATHSYIHGRPLSQHRTSQNAQIAFLDHLDLDPSAKRTGSPRCPGPLSTSYTPLLAIKWTL